MVVYATDCGELNAGSIPVNLLFGELELQMFDKNGEHNLCLKLVRCKTS